MSLSNDEISSLTTLRGTIKWGYRSSIDILVASLLINMLATVLPLTLMQVYDRIIPYQAVGSMIWLVAGAVVAVIMEGVLRLSREQMTSWLSARYEHTLSCHAVGKVLEGSIAELEKEDVAVHMDRIKSISTLKQSYCRQFLLASVDLPFAIMYLATMWFLAPMTAWIVISIIASSFVVTAVMRKPYRKARSVQADAENDKTNFIIESLTKIHYLKAFAQEELFNLRFSDKQSKECEANLHANSMQTFQSNLGSVAGQAALFLVIGIGGGAVSSGQATVGVLTACMLLGVRAVQPAQSLIGYWFHRVELEVSKNKVEALLQTPASRDRMTFAMRSRVFGAIAFESVSHRNTPAAPQFVRDLNLNIDQGEFIGITASSSPGYGSLLSLICGLDFPEEGTVRLDGFDISLIDPDDLKKSVCYVPETPLILKGSVLDNIALFDPRRYTAARETAEMLGLDFKISELANGYLTQLGSESIGAMPAVTLNLISLARALMIRPKVMLFGQVDAGLDDESLEIFEFVVRQLKGDTTVILASDRPSLLSHSDRIFRLSFGKLVETTQVSLLPDSKGAHVQIWLEDSAEGVA